MKALAVVMINGLNSDATVWKEYAFVKTLKCFTCASLRICKSFVLWQICIGCMRLFILNQCFSLLNCWYHLPNQCCPFEKAFCLLVFLCLSFNLYLSNLFPHILLICSYSFKLFCFSLKKSPPNQDQKITESPRTSECVLCVLYTPLFRFFFFYCWYCCLVSLLLLLLLNSHFLFELYLKFEFWLLFDI